jgi:pimeloyl-ACP methyl ester carboxylesterase
MSTHAAPDRYLERDGARLRWRLEGSGPAIALLHGWALDLEYWDPLIPLLAARFTLLRFDRRGFGRSTGLPDIHSNVEDLRALLDAAAIERTILVGMSQGARLALHFSLDQPERTRALVLDGAPALEAESDLPLDRFRNQLQTGGVVALQADIAAHPLMRLQTLDKAAAGKLVGIVARYKGQDLLQSVARARAPDVHAITAPTLVLNGSRDSPSRLEAGRDLQSNISGAQIVEIAGAGHLALLDDPAGYAQALTAFCDALPH